MTVYALHPIAVGGEHHDAGDPIDTDKATAEMLVRTGRASREKPEFAKPTAKAKAEAQKAKAGEGNEGHQDKVDAGQQSKTDADQKA